MFTTLKFRTACALALPLVSALARASDATELDLEALMGETIQTASKYDQSIRDVPAAVSVLTREDIRAFGWRTLSEALSSLPGTQTTYDRQYNYLGVRGLGPPGDFNTRVLVAINGNRMNDVVYDGAQVGREFPLDLDLVERIEYILGPGGAIYGQNAMFAVVNVITRSGLQLDGAESVLLGAEPNDQRELAWRWGKRLRNGTDILLSLGGMAAEGEDLPLRFPGAAADGSDVEGMARGLDSESDREAYAQIHQGPWQFNVSYGLRQKDDPTGSYFSDPLSDGQYSRDRNLNAQLQYQRTLWNDDLDVLVRGFLGRMRYQGSGIYAGENNYSNGISNWQGGELRFVYRGVENHTLLAGIEAQQNSRADQDSYDLAPGGADIDIASSGDRAGLYLQDEWQVAPAWQLTLGARFDHNHITNNKLSPRAALVWQPTQQTAWKALFGRAWRAPNAYESLFEDGTSLMSNRFLRGERNDTWELLWQHQMTPQVELRASVYHWLLTDLIVLGTQAASGLPQYANGPTLDADGTELAVVANGQGGLRLWASVGYQELQYEDHSPVVNSSPWLVKLALSQPLPWQHLTMAFETQYDGARDTLRGDQLTGTWLAHASLSGATGIEGLEWSLSVRNLFDRHYAWPAADTNWQDSLEQEGRLLRLRLNMRY